MLDLIGEWQAHRRRSGESINDTIAALLEQVNFDHVKPQAIIEAFDALLAGLPSVARASVSHAANREREILAICVGDKALGLTTQQLIAEMSSVDQDLVSLLDRLRRDPAVLCAVAVVIEVLRNEPGNSPVTAAAKAQQMAPTAPGEL